MFEIKGHALFSESDMFIGEKLEETLKNEGFDVHKEYLLSNPVMLTLTFGVEKADDATAESLFSIE